MKSRIAYLIVALSLSAAVFAACPPLTDFPTCAPGTKANSSYAWPCCNMAAACSLDGTKFERWI